MKDQALYETLQMIPVKAGTFLMGTTKNEYDALERRSIVHKRSSEWEQEEITLTRAYELGKFPVTNLVWSLVTEEPLEADPLLPKTHVSWRCAAYFCQKLNELLGLPQAMARNKDGNWTIDLDSPGFRLPTEAEWERAALAGLTVAQYGPIDEIAWHRDNADGKTHLVGEKLPNPWGLYDMLGNVTEWCWDWFSDKRTSLQDPLGPEAGNCRCVRGGSWYFEKPVSSATFRLFYSESSHMDDLGFRLARSI